MVTIKMVKGESYTCEAFNKTARRGDIFEVDETAADLILKDFYLDTLNNRHFYFEVVDSGSSKKPAAASNTTDTLQQGAEGPPKRRGRPPGSKNVIQ